MRRCAAFAEAGADVIYAPFAPMEAQEELCRIGTPVNLLAAGKFAELTVADYAVIGVARISIGGALARVTHKVDPRSGQGDDRARRPLAADEHGRGERRRPVAGKGLGRRIRARARPSRGARAGPRAPQAARKRRPCREQSVILGGGLSFGAMSTQPDESCEPRRAARRAGGRAARQALRAAPLAEDVRPVRPGLAGGTFQPLTEAGVQRIHQAALDACEQIGFADAPATGVEILTRRRRRPRR